MGFGKLEFKTDTVVQVISQRRAKRRGLRGREDADQGRDKARAFELKPVPRLIHEWHRRVGPVVARGQVIELLR